jgi:hypothetical protein
MTTMMRAVVVDRPGPPEVLTLRKVPRPTVREGWTLIQVKGFGLKAETTDPARGQRGGCGHERDGPSTAPCRRPSTASPGEPTGSTRTGSSGWRNRPGTPLAEPIHPDELGRRRKQHGKDRNIKYNRGSLYMVEELRNAGFITEPQRHAWLACGVPALAGIG